MNLPESALENPCRGDVAYDRTNLDYYYYNGEKWVLVDEHGVKAASEKAFNAAKENKYETFYDYWNQKIRSND